MTVHRFGAFTLDPEQAELRGPDGPVAMEPQVFDVLVHLATRPGRLVTKEQLLDEVWGDRFVSISALTSRIRAARRAIGDDGKAQWAIATVHGRGYRFVAEVTVEEDGPSAEAATAPPAPVPGVWPRPRVLPPELRPDTRRPFVGRTEELGAASAVLEDDLWATRVVWILGEPGIGKTRLAAQLAQGADRRGAAVLFGRCDEDLSVPLQPFAEVLRASTEGLADDELRAHLGAAPAALVRLLPDLASRLPDLETPAGLDVDSERYRLFEAVVGWLVAATADRPHVVVVDDAHWATESTVQLLDHLLRSTRPTRATLLVTARDTSPDENPRLAEVVAASTQRGLGISLHLDGLDRSAVEALVPDSASVDRLLAATAGNPLLLDAMADDDGSSRGVSAAVRRRLSRLDQAASDTLGLAAVSGLEFDLRVVAAAADRTEMDVIDDLERAHAARLVDEVAIDTYRFTHALVRSSLRDEVSASRRARLHRRLAQAVEEVHAGGRDPPRRRPRPPLGAGRFRRRRAGEGRHLRP